MFGIVVDINTGFITQDVVHIFEDGTLDSCVLEDNEIVIKYNGKNPAGNMNKPQWQFDTKKWIDTAPLPPVEIPPQEPNEMEVLEGRVVEIENINAGLLLENAEHQIKIQEQEKMNKEQEVTNANLLLEIAMLKGAML